MFDVNELRYGLRPFKSGDYLAVFGARAIFQRGEIGFLPDRSNFLGNPELEDYFLAGIFQPAIEDLKQYIKKHNITSSSSEIYTHETWLYRIEASPNASCGYFYITIYMKGCETRPDGKWSGTFFPKIGDKIKANINEIGICQVLGYYEEGGYIGVIAKPEKPPKWYIKQNGKYGMCGLFGAEIRELKDE